MASRFRLLVVLVFVVLLGLLVPSALLAQKTVPPSGPPAVDPPSVCDAIAGNLVQNCGFETGSFSSWTQSGNLGFTSVASPSTSPFVNSGNYGAQLGPIGSDGFLTQAIATTAGAMYRLTFWLYSPGGFPNDFSASENGVTLFTQTNIPAQPYTQYTFDFVAGAASTLLQFAFRNDPSYLGLDDISLVQISATPEPSSLFLMGTGLLIAGSSLRRRFVRA